MGSPPPSPRAVGVPADLKLGPVVLRAADLEAMARFYREAIGLETVRSSPGVEVLGSGGDALVELRSAPGAPPRAPGTTGLFHLAILEPDRPALAGALRRLLDAGAPPAGASDHLVSEAIYLDDPEGNGVEIYRDRPAGEWSWSEGEVSMATLPLDAASLLAEAGGEAQTPGARRLGHVHMNVSDLGEAREFYVGVLGLEVTHGSYPGALFVSAGGYHHHFGLNLWAGEGAPRPAQDALGLAGVCLAVPEGADLDAIEQRARAAGAPARRDGDDLVVTDPFGVSLAIAAR